MPDDGDDGRLRRGGVRRWRREVVDECGRSADLYSRLAVYMETGGTNKYARWRRPRRRRLIQRQHSRREETQFHQVRHNDPIGRVKQGCHDARRQIDVGWSWTLNCHTIPGHVVRQIRCKQWLEPKGGLRLVEHNRGAESRLCVGTWSRIGRNIKARRRDDSALQQLLP